MSEYEKINEQQNTKSQSITQDCPKNTSVLQRAKLNTYPLSHNDVMQLQSAMGNRAVAQLFSTMSTASSDLEQQPIQKKNENNNTGLPDNLKSGVENLSGMSLDDVSVHYNSAKPAGLNALAYTQGTDIHVAPGQEQHLPHEAWHVIQQKQGRVVPTIQAKGINVNDDSTLEKEADVMGIRALSSSKLRNNGVPAVQKKSQNVVQRWAIDEIFTSKTVPWGKTSRVETINDGGRDVCFFYDSSEEPLVVKKGKDFQEAPGLFNLVADVQEIVGMKSSRMFRANDAEREQILHQIRHKSNNESFDILGNTLNSVGGAGSAGLAPAAANPGWTKTTATPRMKGITHRYNSFKDGPIFVSSYAKGKDGDKLLKESVNKTAKKSILDYLKDKDYMYKVGKLSAADFFLNFTDRALSANIGNWMTTENGAITLIDNVDFNFKAAWQQGFVDEVAGDAIDKLAPDKIEDAATEIYGEVFGRISRVYIASQSDKEGTKFNREKFIKKHNLDKDTYKYRASVIKNIQRGLEDGVKNLLEFIKNNSDEYVEMRDRITGNANSYTQDDQATIRNSGGNPTFDYRVQLFERMLNLSEKYNI